MRCHWIVELTSFQVKSWDPKGDDEQNDVGTASGRVVVVLKDMGWSPTGPIKESWIAGTFKAARVSYRNGYKGDAPVGKKP